MKSGLTKMLFTLLIASAVMIGVSAQTEHVIENTRAIEFPDISGYLTLKCDLHMHTVLSDGSVWPDIRVKEAVKEVAARLAKEI